MHETALMKHLVRKINELAAKEGASQVVSISVWLGALSHLDPGHFMEHYNEDAAGTAAAGAKVNFELSNDPRDPRARDVVLKTIEVAEA